MSAVLYVTSNPHKLKQAQLACDEFGLELHQTAGDFLEIQSDRAEDIARNKADQAFEQLSLPLVVSDDSWIIPGLNGFPGPYMKYVNDWFTVDDWLHLTRPLQDRRILFEQTIIYQDEHGQTLFQRQLEGILLSEPRGRAVYPHTALISFDNGKHTNAELHQQGIVATGHLPNVWRSFAEWYSERHDR